MRFYHPNYFFTEKVYNTYNHQSQKKCSDLMITVFSGFPNRSRRIRRFISSQSIDHIFATKLFFQLLITWLIRVALAAWILSSKAFLTKRTLRSPCMLWADFLRKSFPGRIARTSIFDSFAAIVRKEKVQWPLDGIQDRSMSPAGGIDNRNT